MVAGNAVAVLVAVVVVSVAAGADRVVRTGLGSLLASGDGLVDAEGMVAAYRSTLESVTRIRHRTACESGFRGGRRGSCRCCTIVLFFDHVQ